MKSRKRLVAVIAAASTAAFTLYLGVGHAATPVPSGTAKITTATDILAGTTGPVTIHVTNPQISGMTLNMASVNLVVIHPATGFTIQTPPSPAPSGWHYTLAGGNAVFTGSTISPGSSADFTVPAQATRPAGNLTGAWQAKSSADGGETIVLDSTDPTGTMTTTIHVLKVTAAALTAPAGATDNSVTAGQNNAVVSLTVQNAGSGALTVTPKLTAGGGGDSVGTPPAAQSIAGNDDTGTFAMPVTFGSPTSGTPRHFAADATATGAPAAIGRNTADITVQTATAATYVANSLTPTAVASGSRSFSLSLTKTGDPSVTLDAANTTLNFTMGPKSFALPLASPSSFGAGSTSPLMTFSGTVPGAGTGFADGTYTGSVHVVGTDANGAGVDLTVSVASLTLNNTGPGVVPTLTSPTTDKNGNQVAKDGTTLAIGGNVFQQGTSGPLDQNATITSCALNILGGSSPSHPDVTSSCTINHGVLGGTVTLNSGNLPAGSVSLSVNVKNAANITGSGTSPTVAIDNVAPTYAGATTKDTSTIVVTTSEPVKGTFQAQDWSINGSFASAVSFDGSDSAFGSMITLTTQNPFGPNDTPTVSYSRLVPQARNPVHDAPGNNAPNAASLKAVDGILPPVPTMTLVDGKQKFTDTGKFYTNNASPPLTFSGLSPGDIARVYEHTGDLNVFVCEADQGSGSTATCSASGWTSDTAHTLRTIVTDPTGNHTMLSPAGTVVSDHTNPAITSAKVDLAARTVTVSLSEVLGSGRDFAVDWQVTGMASGQPVSYAIQSVTAPFSSTRVLKIDPGDTSWGAAGSSVQTTTYTFAGSTPTDRYADRAGNFLPDSSIATS